MYSSDRNQTATAMFGGKTTARMLISIFISIFSALFIAEVVVKSIDLPYDAELLVEFIVFFLISVPAFHIIVFVPFRNFQVKISKSEERYRLLFENMTSAVSVYAVENGTRFVVKHFNKASEKMEGLRREDVVGRDIEEVFPNAREFGLMDVLNRVCKSGTPEHVPARFYSGERIAGWRECDIYRLPSGEIVSITVDITEQKKAEAELTNSLNTRQMLLDSLPHPAMLITADRIVLAANRAAVDSGALVGEACWKNFHNRAFADAHALPGHGAACGSSANCFFCDSGIPLPSGAVAQSHKDIFANGKYWDIFWVPINNDAYLHYSIDITERRTAEEQMRIKDAAIEGSLNGMVLADMDARIVYANLSFVSMTGYQNAADFIGKQVTGFLWNASEGDGIIDEIMSKSRYHGDVTVRRRDGRPIHVHLSANVIFDNAGKRNYIIASVVDITERIHALESLELSTKRSETRNKVATALLSKNTAEMYRDVLEIIIEATGSRHGAFGYIDEGGNYVRPSMTRNNWDECRIENKDAVFPKTHWKGVWGKALNEMKPQTANHRLAVPDGHIPIDRALDAPILYRGKPIGNFLVANKKTDYTPEDQNMLSMIADYIAPALHFRTRGEQEERERIAAEAELRKVTTAMEQSPASIFITDTGGVIEYVNRGFTEISGYSFVDAVGKTPRILKSGKTPLETYKQLWETIATGNEWRGELLNRNTSGEFYWVSIVVTPILNEAGIITHYLGISENITQKKRFEAEREQLVEELFSKNAELESFAYTVSHDLKAPLVTIDGFTGALQEEYGETMDETAARYLSRVSAAAQKMKVMIEELLLYSRIGRIREEYSEVPFDDYVAEALRCFDTAIENKRVEIVAHPVPIALWGERTRISQVFENLIGNAIKYIGADNPAPRIEIGAINREGETMFFVRDNGIGVDPKYHVKIFSMFQRLPAAKNIEGSGVGLAIVKRIVESHRGRVEIESEVGKGSTFLFTLEQRSDGH